MTLHLDTNAAIALLNGAPIRVRERFDAARLAREGIAMSIIAYHELMYGAAHSARRTANEDRIALLLTAGRISLCDFVADDAREAADIRAAMRAVATPIGPYDVLIAAQARRAGATLVTANAREFLRVPGLTVVDWSM